jgi:hypothetical protein
MPLRLRKVDQSQSSIAPAPHKFLVMHLWRSGCSALRSYHFLLPFWLLDLLPVRAGQSLKRDQDGEKACMAVTGDLDSQLLRRRNEDRTRVLRVKMLGTRRRCRRSALGLVQVFVSNASRVRVLSSPSQLAPLTKVLEGGFFYVAEDTRTSEPFLSPSPPVRALNDASHGARMLPPASLVPRRFSSCSQRGSQFLRFRFSALRYIGHLPTNTALRSPKVLLRRVPA